MKELDRIVELQKEIKQAYDEGFISIDTDYIQVNKKKWMEVAKGKKVSVHERGFTRGKTTLCPIETRFEHDGLKFICIWSLEDYLEGGY